MDNNQNNNKEKREENLETEEIEVEDNSNNLGNIQLEEIEKLKKEKEEILNSFKRERADFLNYKREEEGRINRRINYFLEKIILDILPVVDSFEIAEKNISEELKKESWVSGFMGIKEQLKIFLKSLNVSEIESVGKEFNPNFHEAVEIIEVNGEKSNIIIEEVQKGYLFENEKVIRASKVKINK